MEKISVEKTASRGIAVQRIRFSQFCKIFNCRQRHIKLRIGQFFTARDFRQMQRDDVFVYIPNRAVAELGDQILAFDGCMNFFAGPTDNQFKAEINLYDVHYTSQHIVGTTGGNNEAPTDSVSLFSVISWLSSPLFFSLYFYTKMFKQDVFRFQVPKPPVFLARFI